MHQSAEGFTSRTAEPALKGRGFNGARENSRLAASGGKTHARQYAPEGRFKIAQRLGAWKRRKEENRAP
jgi:hypothetical protein